MSVPSKVASFCLAVTSLAIGNCVEGDDSLVWVTFDGWVAARVLTVSSALDTFCQRISTGVSFDRERSLLALLLLTSCKIAPRVFTVTR